jgi:hypothetical protein
MEQDTNPQYDNNQRKLLDDFEFQYGKLREVINQRETQIANLIYERDEAIAECRKRKGIEQDMNHYREFADDLYKSVVALYGWLNGSGLRGKHPMIDADLEAAVKLYRQYRKERFPYTVIME